MHKKRIIYKTKTLYLLLPFIVCAGLVASLIIYRSSGEKPPIKAVEQVSNSRAMQVHDAEEATTSRQNPQQPEVTTDTNSQASAQTNSQATVSQPNNNDITTTTKVFSQSGLGPIPIDQPLIFTPQVSGWMIHETYDNCTSGDTNTPLNGMYIKITITPSSYIHLAPGVTGSDEWGGYTAINVPVKLVAPTLSPACSWSISVTQ